MKPLLLFIALITAYPANAYAQSNEEIAFGGRLICQLDNQGGVNCITNDGFTRLNPPANTPTLTTLSAGDVHVCGLTQSGTAFCWGDNNFGQLDIPDSEQFIDISAGTNFSCGVTVDNRVLCWGLDTHGETQPLTDQRYTQTAHDENTSCGVQLDGKVSCWGQFPDLADRLSQYTFTKVDVDSNLNLVCGVTEQNDVRCNFSGLDFTGDMVDVALSSNMYCALSSAGDISCGTNFSHAPWQNHLTTRLAEINNGPDVVALYGDSTGSGVRSNRVCYKNEVGKFGCIVREIFSEPALPGDQPNAPDSAQNLTADVYSDSTIELLWSRPTFDIVGADIYRNGELLTTTSNGSSYIDESLVPGVPYEYTIALFDSTGARSELSNAVSVNTGQDSGGADTSYSPVTRPAEPTGLTVVVYNQSEIELFWDRLNFTPGDFNGYEIYRDHEFIAFTRGISFYDNSVQADSSYDYDVVAVSRDGTLLGFSGVEVYTGVR